MTPEGRLDRIERIAKLFVRAGRRVRANVRDQDEKINILIDLHMKNEELFERNEERFRENEERFRENEERFKKNEERFKKNEERFARLHARTEERFGELADAQADANRRLSSLVDIVREGRGSQA
jgi:predicted RNA-binding protein with RPS1 domain